MSFKKNKYQVIRGAISKELADVCLRYLAMSHNADAYLINKNITHYKNVLIGNFPRFTIISSIFNNMYQHNNFWN